MGLLSKNNSKFSRKEKIEKLNMYFDFNSLDFSSLQSRYLFLKKLSDRSKELGIGFLIKDDFSENIKQPMKSDEFKNIIVDSIYFLK